MHRVYLVLPLTLLSLLPGPLQAQGQGEAPVFRAQVNLVSLAAVVRDRQGHIVQSLAKEDFEIKENGTVVPVLELRNEKDAPANIALLVDGSGSMRLKDSFAVARQVSEQILGSLDQGRDEAALYSFDTRVLTLQAFTPELARVKHALTYLDTWGSTSLYDAISGVAGKIHERGESRRAIVLFTDGADTTSTITPAEVALVTSALDVPVYVFALNSPYVEQNDKAPVPPLAALAMETGGLYFAVTDPMTLHAQVTQLLQELRYQHVLAFEASSQPGWRSLELKVKKRGYKIRTRGWYWAGDAEPPARPPTTTH